MPTRRTLTRSTRLLVAACTGALALSGAAVAVAQAHPVSPEASGSDGARVIGGKASAANLGVVVFLNSNRQHCSGSLIHPQWILSATHCVDGVSKSSATFRVGSLQTNSGGEIVKAESWVSKGDMTLIKLAQPSTSKVLMKLSTVEPKVDDTNTIYGYGATQPGQGQAESPVLKEGDVTITSLDGKDLKGGPAIKSKKKTGSAWQGDSGGPQTFNGLQVGVASTASDQGGTQTYCSVPKLMDWIKSNIKDLDTNPAPAPAPPAPPAP